MTFVFPFFFFKWYTKQELWRAIRRSQFSSFIWLCHSWNWTRFVFILVLLLLLPPHSSERHLIFFHSVLFFSCVPQANVRAFFFSLNLYFFQFLVHIWCAHLFRLLFLSLGFVCFCEPFFIICLFVHNGNC